MDVSYIVIVAIIGIVLTIFSDPNNERGKR